MSATAFVDQQLEVVRRPRAKLPRRPSLLSRLRPQEGWLTLLLVTLAYLAVAWSVAAAGWLREMPSLIPVGLVAILGGLLFAKLPAIWPLPYLVGLVAGVVVSVVQMLFIVTGDGAVERYETFIAAMVNWWEIVTDGGISRDPIPFILSMMLVAWLIAFTASWCTFRWRNAWAALFPLGIGLMTNLSYLPGRLEGFFFLFIAAGILLAVQLHRVEQNAFGGTTSRSNSAVATDLSSSTRRCGVWRSSSSPGLFLRDGPLNSSMTSGSPWCNHGSALRRNSSGSSVPSSPLGPANFTILEIVSHSAAASTIENQAWPPAPTS